MLNWKEAQKQVLREIQPTPVERIALGGAVYRVLAEEIRAPFAFPLYDQSAMDGFAVRTEEATDGSVLRIGGEVPAGRAHGVALCSGEAIRVLTGGEIPANADAIIKQEDVQPGHNGDAIRIVNSVRMGDHIRKRGEEFREGDVVVSVGSRLTPAVIGLCASMGRADVSVFSRPSVAILPTGNELAEIGSDNSERKMFNSNGPMLQAALSADGVAAMGLPIASDDRQALREALERGLESDMLVTCGGISVGKYDYVREELEALGVRVVFHKLAIKPGKPILFGVREEPTRCLVFALPGNPVAAFVTYEIFVRPALRKMLGERFVSPAIQTAVLKSAVRKKPGLTHFSRARVWTREGRMCAESVGTQDSHLLSSVARANALMILEENVEDPAPGTIVPVWPLENFREEMSP